MCGIIGFNFSDKELLKNMMDSIKHRGPDDEAKFIDKDISLGMCRLSIIDLKKGLYPIHNEDNSLFLIFNGEIYNFKEMRLELEKKGHKFYTNCDSEVIIHAYEEWGKNLLQKLNGMFAFAIWDSNKKELFLVRDRLGIKPLYYFHSKNCFIFASEIKAILKYKEFEKSLNNDALNYLLSYRIIPNEECLLKNIKKLLPGEYITLKDNQIKKEKYWDLYYTEEIINENIAQKRLFDLFEDSIKKRLVADVPVGIFLSGGIDSSSVVAIAKKFNPDIRTFTAGFNDPRDEFKYARKTARYFNTNHEDIIIEYDDMTKNFNKIIEHMDEPILDPAIFPVFFVSKLANKKIKVALLGEGADELFAGYTKYNLLKNNCKKYLKADRVFIKEKVLDKNINYLAQQYTKKNDLNKALEFDLKQVLPNFQLMKVDKMTMANSLEARVPFLDHRIVEFSARLPTNLKLKNNTGKYILRKAMKIKIPKEIRETNKRVFFTPLKSWFNNGLREVAKEELKDSKIFKQDFINKLFFKEKYSIRRYKYSNQLWSLLMIEKWSKLLLD